MNRLSFKILILGVTLLLPLAVCAQSKNIYSWTDENGVKHFSDQEPTDVKAEAQAIPVPTEPEPDALADEIPPAEASESMATSQLAATSEAAPSYADQQREEIRKQREASKEEQAERNRLCLQARDRLARIEPNRRVYYTGEDGETTRMDDDERVRQVEENKALVAEYCN
ncbi:MAG TPA: DUF4124 domain-containing protein [Xanthomonadales bacterium]|nr:DUF4124 domain-containing protein [Xanthomonadales bacterium]